MTFTCDYNNYYNSYNYNNEYNCITVKIVIDYASCSIVTGITRDNFAQN